MAVRKKASSGSTWGREFKKSVSKRLGKRSSDWYKHDRQVRGDRKKSTDTARSEATEFHSETKRRAKRVPGVTQRKKIAEAYQSRASKKTSGNTKLARTNKIMKGLKKVRGAVSLKNARRAGRGALGIMALELANDAVGKYLSRPTNRKLTKSEEKAGQKMVAKNIRKRRQKK